MMNKQRLRLLIVIVLFVGTLFLGARERVRRNTDRTGPEDRGTEEILEKNEKTEPDTEIDYGRLVVWTSHNPSIIKETDDSNLDLEKSPGHVALLIRSDDELRAFCNGLLYEENVRYVLEQTQGYLDAGYLLFFYGGSGYEWIYEGVFDFSFSEDGSELLITHTVPQYFYAADVIAQCNCIISLTEEETERLESVVYNRVFIGPQ